MGRLFQQNDCWHGNGALCGGGIEVICKVGCFSHKVVTFSKMPSSTGLNYWVLSSSLPPKSKHSIWWWGSTYSVVICVQSSSFMHGSWRMLERKTRQKMTVSLVFMWLGWSFFPPQELYKEHFDQLKPFSFPNSTFSWLSSGDTAHTTSNTVMWLPTF